jgi:hypothetical protein
MARPFGWRHRDWWWERGLLCSHGGWADGRWAGARPRRRRVKVGQRLSSHAANESRQEEIECDLRRIEHHCALFLAQAAQAGGMGEVSLQIDLDLSAGSTVELFSEASQLLLHESGQYYLEAA